MSAQEFSEYLSNIRMTKILFASCDQEWFSENNTLDFYVEFDKIDINQATNTIYLTGTAGEMRIKGIQNILINNIHCVLGAVVEIYCQWHGVCAKYIICLCD